MRRPIPTPKTAARAWAALEDRLYPALRCSPVERTLYNHLLRHTLLEGRRMIRRTKAQLSRATGICGTAVRDNLRALEAKACLRIRERAKRGLLIEVRWPQMEATEAPFALSHEALGKQRTQRKRRIGSPWPLVGRSFSSDNKPSPGHNPRRGDGLKPIPTAREEKISCTQNVGAEAPTHKPPIQSPYFPKTPQASLHYQAPPYEPLARRRVSKNPFKSARFRRAMRRRERGRCFYCQIRLRAGHWGLDHIVSRARGGGHDARNAAACCTDCNRQKAEQDAAAFLAHLHQEGRLDTAQWRARLAALQTRRK